VPNQVCVFVLYFTHSGDSGGLLARSRESVLDRSARARSTGSSCACVRRAWMGGKDGLDVRPVGGVVLGRPPGTALPVGRHFVATGPPPGGRMAAAVWRQPFRPCAGSGMSTHIGRGTAAAWPPFPRGRCRNAGST